MKRFLKALLRFFLGDYGAYYIYAASTATADKQLGKTNLKIVPAEQAALDIDPAPLVRKQAAYAGEDARAYACWLDDRIVGVCFYWWGKRYLQRNFWPLRENEAKLVQIITLPEARGLGVATALIAASCQDMGHCGFGYVFARIWHSNFPSWRAFERAGWKRIALVIEINPLRQSKPLRLRFRKVRG